MKRLEFDPAAFEDLGWWIEKDRKKALQIVKLVEAIQRDPFRGLTLAKTLVQEKVGSDNPHFAFRPFPLQFFLCAVNYWQVFSCFCAS